MAYFLQLLSLDALKSESWVETELVNVKHADVHVL
jgi:hypothetical protein